MHQRIADCFGRHESRERTHIYLQGLLAPLERKNGWQLAEAADDRSPDDMQDFLAHAPVGHRWKSSWKSPVAAGRSNRRSNKPKAKWGVDQYEVLRYDAWYRHITLALLAHAYLAAVRARSAGKNTGPAL